jgi:DMSO/TMAO reductase YedYZ molybdopterin-dependent catalytic subunit
MALGYLLSRTDVDDRAPAPTDPAPAPADTAPAAVAPLPRAPHAFDRRAFVRGVATLGGAAAAAAVAGVVVSDRRFGAIDSRASVAVPMPAEPAVQLPAGTELDVPGITPFLTPNDDFYRVDTALFPPQVRTEDWRLRIHGMVDRPIELTYPQLLDREVVERDITLSCVSNEVGGPYAGTARWTGVLLRPLLEEAGVHADATQLVSRSADGMTIGTPTAAVMDGRDAMLAVAMNAEPLPIAHGFPVRMVVPGLFGYVSATKWVVAIEATTFEAFDAYWIERGWAEDPGPIKTTSRIDTPRGSASSGTVAVAGVAWAPHRGIERVEVRVDEGPWNVADLAAVPSVDTWRQWVFRWEATPGSHRLEVRATDGDSITQTEERTPPFPDGSTGWHAVTIDVS